MAVSGKRVVTTHSVHKPGKQTATKISASAVAIEYTGKAVVVDGAVKDYTKDPYFIRKTESARTVIAKVGLPKKEK